MGTQVRLKTFHLNLNVEFKMILTVHRFIQFLKNFKSNDMEIAFSSERSIQDAIQELSEGESSTVIISYGVMFIYVAIALGNFKSFKTFLVRFRN